MNYLVVSAVVFIVCGFMAAFIGVLRYSDFLARLYVIDKSLVVKWSIEMDAGENWSNKNIAIVKLFLSRNYLDIADEKITKIGNSVVRTQIIALILTLLGVLLYSVKGSVS